jgi:hypothetical protein
MGINILTDSKYTKAIKLRNSLISYIFEEDYGELMNAKDIDKKRLKRAVLALGNIIKLGQKK